MVDWWDQKIEAAIRESSEIFLTPSDLEVIFSIDGLKPVPLSAMLSHLTKSNKLEWIDRPQ